MNRREVLKTGLGIASTALIGTNLVSANENKEYNFEWKLEKSYLNGVDSDGNLRKTWFLYLNGKNVAWICGDISQYDPETIERIKLLEEQRVYCDFELDKLYKLYKGAKCQKN